MGSVEWLKGRQRPTGEFPTIGRLVHKGMKGGLSKSTENGGIGLTAYTIGALIEGGVPPTDEHVQRGLRFLSNDTAALETLDSYSLLMIANTLTLVDVEHPLLAHVSVILDSRKKGESGIRFWSDSPPGAAAAVSSSDIEMTAYALSTSVKLGHVTPSVEMTRWLTQQRNGKGGFLSTQDTVVAIQALAKVSAMLHAKTGHFRVKFETKKKTEEFELNRGNRLLLHRADMEFAEDPSERILNVDVSPLTPGCAMVQARLRYNAGKQPKKEKEVGEKSFRLKQRAALVRDRENHCKWRQFETCLTYQGESSSGMVMVEVKMVSGWIPDKESLKKITSGSKTIKRFDVDPRMIKFYLDNLKADSTFCFEYLVEQQIRVGNAKPGLVKVYDYYEPDIVVDQKFKIKQTCGTKEEIPFVIPPGVEAANPFMQRRVNFAPDGPFITPSPPAAGRDAQGEDDDDDDEGYENDCPDCAVKSFSASYCDAALVVSATVLPDRQLRIFGTHKGDSRANGTVTYALDDEDDGDSSCQCSLLSAGQHVLLMFRDDEDVVFGGSTSVIDLDDDVSVIPLQSIDSIAPVIPTTLMARTAAEC